MVDIDKIKKYALCFLCVLILIFSYIKVYGLYNKYKADEESKKYTVVVVQNLGEDESKVKYLVKLNSDSFILNIYKENKFDKGQDEKGGGNKDKHSKYAYGDKLEVKGKIVKLETYGNPRGIRLW